MDDIDALLDDIEFKPLKRPVRKQIIHQELKTINLTDTRFSRPKQYMIKPHVIVNK